MMSLRSAILVTVCLLATAASARPPMTGHPIIGTWLLQVSGTTCRETWQFHPDGTTFNASGDERSTSEYEISDRPNSEGYYVLSDIIRATNGKPDCFGKATPIGDRAVNYLLLEPTGEFIVCSSSSHDSCFATMARSTHPDS